MRLAQACLSVLLLAATASGQGFEFPVQLIGFPVIIIAVRIANFIKKLTYALNPNTYRSRIKRGLPVDLDLGEVEKRLVSEMGEKVCVFEDVCTHYALQSLQPEADIHLDWEEIFRKFSTSPKDKAEFYLLSVFLGDIVGSPNLCRQLGKRRTCGHHSNAPYPLPQYLKVPSEAPDTSSSSSTFAPSLQTPVFSVRSTPQPFFLPMEPQLGFTPQR